MMKSFLLTTLMMFVASMAFSQISLGTSIINTNQSPSLNKDQSVNNGTIKLFSFNSISSYVPENFSFSELETRHDSVKYLRIDASSNRLAWDVHRTSANGVDTIAFFYKDSNGTRTSDSTNVFYCNDKFVLTEGECNETNATNVPNDITDIEIPNFHIRSSTSLSADKRNRYLIIDLNANVRAKLNNVVYKRKNPDSVDPSKSFEELFEFASPYAGGSMSVHLINYNDNKLEQIVVKLNSVNLTFDAGLQEIFDQLRPNENGDKGEPDDPVDAVSADSNCRNTLDAVRRDWLNQALDSFNAAFSLNVNHLRELNNYKNDLKRTVQERDIEFCPQTFELYEQVLNWLPATLDISSPLGNAIEVPDVDLVRIKVETKHKGSSTISTSSVGSFRTVGGLSRNIGSSIYFTGLRNNSIFTDMVDIDGMEELRAQIEEDDQLSVGLGLSTDIGFRTGSIVEPSFNLGFFVPLEEDLSPFIGVGPGVNFRTERVKLGVSGGITFGRVNAIAEQYDGEDLSDLMNLINTDLSTSVWESSWYFSLGVRYKNPLGTE